MTGPLNYDNGNGLTVQIQPNGQFTTNLHVTDGGASFDLVQTGAVPQIGQSTSTEVTISVSLDLGLSTVTVSHTGTVTLVNNNGNLSEQINILGNTTTIPLDIPDEKIAQMAQTLGSGYFPGLPAGGSGPSTDPSASSGDTGLTGGVGIDNIATTAQALMNMQLPGTNQTLGQYFGSQQYSQQEALAYITSVLSKNSTYDSTTGKYVTNLQGTRAISKGDQAFYGMVFANHDFHAAGGAYSVTVQGAVVAYGGNPANYTQGTVTTYPGADGTGIVDMQGQDVNFIYDPTYLGGIARVYCQTYVPATRLYFSLN
jgi:hypothetical protein